MCRGSLHLPPTVASLKSLFPLIGDLAQNCQRVLRFLTKVSSLMSALHAPKVKVIPNECTRDSINSQASVQNMLEWASFCEWTFIFKILMPCYPSHCLLSYRLLAFMDVCLAYFSKLCHLLKDTPGQAFLDT